MTFDELVDEFHRRIQSNSHRFLKRLHLEFISVMNNSPELSNFSTIDEKVWALRNKQQTRPMCYCGNHTKFHLNSGKYHIFCSSSCSRKNPVTLECRNEKRLASGAVEKIQETIATRYSKEKIKQLRQEGVYNKFGVNNYFATPESKIRNKEHNLKNYGVEYYTQTDEYKTKSRNTYRLRYGVDHYSQSETAKEFAKIRYLADQQDRLHSYGVGHTSQIKISNVLPLIENPDWLYEQYITHNKSTQQLVDELGISATTVLNYLRKHEIGIKYNFGYSHRCIQWIESITNTHGIDIQHALNGGEYVIPNTRYRADGYCAATNTIYEFHGDIWHGNLAVFRETDQPNPFSNLTAKELYEKTLKKENYIKDMGYNLVVMWENDWINKQTVNRKFVQDFLLASNGNLNARALEKHSVTKEQAYQCYHDLLGPRLCQECQAPTTFISFKKGYTTFCSKSCVSNNKDVMGKKTSTLIRNYGEDGFKSAEIQTKKKNTSIINYGVQHPRQNTEYVNAQRQKFLKEYGIANPANTEEANKKRITTNLERYGTVNPASNKEVYSKIVSTNIEKYGVSTALLLPNNRISALSARKDINIYDKLDDAQWLEENKNVPSPVLAESLGIAWSTVLKYYKKHNITRPHITISSFELKLIDFLKEHNLHHISSDRTVLDGKEIDIYLPEFKIGLEIDGLYWHSEHYIKDKYYHAKKSNLALEKGIQLIHITDYELSNQFEIVKNRILAKLGKQRKVFARKCVIVPVKSVDYESFMVQHHIQGSAPASVRIGLKYENELVAVMSFSRARYNRNYEWELIRYATQHSVVGGASRLFSHFTSTVLPKSVISYADLRWNTGDVYAKIGMTLSHTTTPNYWYIENGRLAHRTKYQKHKLRKLLSLYDDSLSEWENMKNNGYTRYWDCGNKVFTWSN